MANKPAEIFCEHHDLEGFRECIMGLEGNFDLERDEMIKLGEEYFKQYPDSFAKRNYDNIHTGYRLMRVCMLEKMMCDFSDPARTVFRSCFDAIKTIAGNLDGYTKSVGRETAVEQVLLLEKRIYDMNKLVESMPTGMVKERFVGGIAHFYNIIYLMKLALGLTEG